MRRLIHCILVPCSFFAVTAWLFFDFAPIALLFLPYVPYDAFRRLRRQREAERWQMALAFRDLLLYLQNGLAAGQSPEGSMGETARGLEHLYGAKSNIVSECRLMLFQMSNGYSMERAFEEFGERSKVEEIRQFAEVFLIAKRTGGEIGKVIRQTCGVLQDKLELKRELRTAIAAKEMEFHIMCFIPHGILLYLRLCAPSMSAPLYGNAFGAAFMGGVFLCWFALSAFGNYLVRSCMSV